MKVLIDTCVVIDALQSREPFREDAEKIFLNAANSLFEGFITAKSATDIYYLTHRYTHNDKETRKILSKIFTLFTPLDTAGIDCSRAINSEISDYEDAVMVETALRTSIDCIVTRNQKDYRKSTIPVFSTSDLLNRLSRS